MPDPIDVGTRWELLVDDYLVEDLQRLRFELHRPERREAAFRYDAPWEDDIAFSFRVLEDSGTVRMYYRASIQDRGNEDLMVCALAESADGGRTFQRPDLGLTEYHGSRHNNILAIGQAPFLPPPPFVDTRPGCPPAERYKGLGARWQKLFALASADGLRWRPLSEEPLVMDGTFDTVNTAFWDGVAGCYRSFTRYFENLQPGMSEADVLGPRPRVVRAIQSSTSEDFLHWTPPMPHRYDDGYDTMQLYTNATLPCPDAEHIYLSFPNRYVQERTLDPDHGTPGINDGLFMASRDGVHWHRYPEAWVRPGLDELNWTDRNNYPIWGIVRTSPTEWSMYVSERYRHPGVPGQLRRLAVRPHGFVSLRADFAGGELLTRPLVFAGRELHLNYSTSAAGSLQVEIQRPDGSPVPGFGLEDMEPAYGDRLDGRLAWGEGADLASLAGQPVRLRILLRDADLYALAFR